MAEVVVMIPARLGSTRFPRKVLADATGKPLIQHVVEAASRSGAGTRVVVATDDESVMRAVKGFGGVAVMTSVEHPNGTSRLAEAATLLGLGHDDVVVNVQGDEPELEPTMVDAAVAALSGGGCPMATVAVPFAAGEDPGNPNLVKVVTREDGQALYFSRALIPFRREGGAAGAMHRPLKHVGLYVYRRWFLDRYPSLPPSPLEQVEMLEQLRALHWGFGIAVATMDVATHGGIDTPEQYDAFVARWRARHGT